MMDVLMLATLAASFLLVKWFTDWCMHEIEKK